MPKRSVSGCDLRFRTAIWSYHRGQGCDLGNCVAKTQRYCVCVWTTKFGPCKVILLLRSSQTASKEYFKLVSFEMSRVENAPTCYRAPRWPDPEFPRKIPKKIPPGPKCWTRRLYPKNTPKIPKRYPQNTRKGIFRYFWGILLSSRISARVVFFLYFSGNSGSGRGW